MPFGDGTGPLGEGPRLGRCAGPTVPGGMNPGWGRGFGGGGRGWRHRFGAPGTAGTAPIANAFVTVTDEGEIAALKGEAESLQNTLNQMKKRIEELEVKE
jgi:hypothetical protein